jgi:uncharacterized membrane protein
MYLIFAVAIAILFIMIFRQSERIRKLQTLLDISVRDIMKLKKELTELKTSAPNAPEKPADATGEVKPAVETPPRIERPAVKADARPAAPPAIIPDRVAPQVAFRAGTPTVRPAESAPAKTDKASDHGINWENFLGVKMFAWIGGFLMFISFAFLLKYSFDHNLISYAMRVVIGFIGGAGLIGGGIELKRKNYAVTSQTLCATGIVILYASSFAAHSIYHFPFFGTIFTFLLMSLITAGAFVLAAGMRSMVIAILGLVGGFLTPVLLPTIQDQPFALFSFISFLNVGLFCVAFHRKWNFLAAPAAVGTVLIQTWWTVMFFRPEKIFTAMAVYLWFNLLFCLAFLYHKKTGNRDSWLAGCGAALPFVTFVFTFYLLFLPGVGNRPGVIFSFLLGADLCILAVGLLHDRLRILVSAAGGCVFLVLGAWILEGMKADQLLWALGASLFFAVLHSALPMIAVRMVPSGSASWQIHFFPLLAIVITLIPITRGIEGNWLVWPLVLVLNAGVLLLALWTLSSFAILATLTATTLVMFVWVVGRPAKPDEIPGLLVLISAFGIFFSVAANYALSRLRRKLADTGPAAGKGTAVSAAENMLVQIPVFSAVLPFLLLALVAGTIRIADTTPVFCVGLLLTALTVGLVRFLKAPLLLFFSMGSFLLLETVLHFKYFHPGNAPEFLVFHVLTTALFFLFPFVFMRDYLKTALPWANAALAGALHFFLIYDTIKQAYPNDFMGLVPALMAIPFFFGLTTLLRQIPDASKARNAILAWFGGATLFFITLIFPIQFDRQWITIGWALEGVALLWLFGRIPHPGLRGTGICLLVTAFARLALNPEILLHYPHSAYPILNWYLYTYGIVVICLMAGGRLLAPPRNRAFGIHIPPLLYSLGTILAFLLMNIEIADLFSPGFALKFQITGDLARGMTYSIAWALFALGLLVAGILKQTRTARYAAIALIGVTLVKLFFFDLSQLEQLYRIGAFIGVAVVLIAASTLYQKWIARKT